MLLKIISIILCCFIISSNCGDPHGGVSQSQHKQDKYGNYEFKYDIVDPWGAQNYRQEAGNAWEQIGSYGLYDVDGRKRVVAYVADGHGFRATLKSNEPGVGSQDAANAVYNGPDKHGKSVTKQYVGGYGHGHHGHGHGHGHGHHGHGHGHGHHGYGHGHGHGHHGYGHKHHGYHGPSHDEPQSQSEREY